MTTTEPPSLGKLGSTDETRRLLRRRRTRKTTFNQFMDGVVVVAALVAVVPLFSVLLMLVVKGLKPFHLSMLWSLPPAPGSPGGGFGNAIAGTLAMVGLGTAISLPAGLLTAVYLTQFAERSRLGGMIRFSAKILSGLPSILAGVFVYGAIVLTFQRFSLLAGGVALAILMFPIIALATEEALLRVPSHLREASLALGATRSQTILRVILPAAGPSILTGLTLAVARAAGETAPLIFTALFSDYWVKSLTEPTASLSVLIYNFSGVPYEHQLEIAWSASLVLIFMVLAANITSRWLARPRH